MAPAISVANCDPRLVKKNQGSRDRHTNNNNSDAATPDHTPTTSTPTVCASDPFTGSTSTVCAEGAEVGRDSPTGSTKDMSTESPANSGQRATNSNAASNGNNINITNMEDNNTTNNDSNTSIPVVTSTVSTRSEGTSTSVAPPELPDNTYLHHVRAIIVLLWAFVDLLWIRSANFQPVAVLAACTVIAHGYLMGAQVQQALNAIKLLKSYPKGLRASRAWWRMPAIHETLMIMASTLWVTSNMIWAVGECIALNSSAYYNEVYVIGTNLAIVVVFPAILVVAFYWCLYGVAYHMSKKPINTIIKEEPLLITPSILESANEAGQPISFYNTYNTDGTPPNVKKANRLYVGCSELTTVEFDRAVLWEDLMLTFWILKDTFWMYEWQYLWTCTVLAICYIFIFRVPKNTMMWLLGLWIVSNILWAGGELYWDDEVPGIPSGDLEADLDFILPPLFSLPDPRVMGMCWWLRWLSGWVLGGTLPVICLICMYEYGKGTFEP